MRALLLSLIAAVLGAAAAWGATAYEFRKPERVVPVVNPHEPRATAEIEGGSVFNFGTMQVGETQQHVFVVKNVGDAPLELTAGQPSCKCTVSEVSAEPVLPGESREVLLTWKPVGAEEKFRQRAPIFTNDPEQRELTLTITGRVAEFYKLEPDPLALGQFSPTEEIKHDINVWGYQSTPWKFQDYECLEADTAEFFTLTARDMSPEEIAGAAGARNGQILTVKIKPGLPLGSVRQRLLITSSDGTSKPAELSITGKAVGDVSVIGRDYNAAQEYIDLGNVPAAAGRKTSLSLLVKGIHRQDVQFTIQSVDPPELQVSLGKPTGQGKSVTWPLLVEVPQGASPVNRLGSELGRMGQIELATGTPEVPNCLLRVRYSVTAD